MRKLIFVLSFLLLVFPCQARTLFVDANTPDNNDGSSWAKAYKYLQDALADADSSGDVNEIWVAQGIYRPDETTSDPNGSGDREATFQLINGVALRGGYARICEISPNDRDWDLYETVLSGDINMPVDNNDNCYHIFYHPNGANLNSTAVLDGFTISGGNADVFSGDKILGGGMYNDYSNPTIINCTFSGNVASFRGGGMYNYYSSPTLTKCTFSSNVVPWVVSGGGGDGGGGAIYNYYSNPALTDCSFSGNSTNDGGGGIFNHISCNPILTNCIFNENTASNGGGIKNWSCSPTLTKCVFNNNSADYGGGVYSYGSQSTLTNCTFNGNSAIDGGGMRNSFGSLILNYCTFNGNSADIGGGMRNYGCSPLFNNCTLNDNSAVENGGGMNNDYSSNPTLINCILWDNNAPNGPQIYDGANGTNSAIVTYSDVQGMWGGIGNIDSDPCFADVDANDFHLQSQAGRWDKTTQSWIHDANTSPCIDAGDPDSSIGYELFPNGGRVNMGAYGGTIEASKSYFSAPVCEKNIAGDINGDCIINFIDLAFMARHWLVDNN